MTWDCILPLSQIRRVRTATLVTLRVVLEITRLLQRRSGPDKRFSIISWSLSARDESVTGARIYNRLHGDQHRPVFPDIWKACVEKWRSGRAHLGIKVWLDKPARLDPVSPTGISDPAFHSTPVVISRAALAIRFGFGDDRPEIPDVYFNATCCGHCAVGGHLRPWRFPVFFPPRTNSRLLAHQIRLASAPRIGQSAFSANQIPAISPTQVFLEERGLKPA